MPKPEISTIWLLYRCISEQKILLTNFQIAAAKVTSFMKHLM